ncbi:MAG: oligoendopeptidase F [Candidatus Kapabacteria bacterium]|nr:oligoendopeptidase F [Candidatus Kapabacteria bacterium]
MNGQLKLRLNINEKYKWDLNPIYPTLDDWEKDLQFVESNYSKIKNFESKLGNSSNDLLLCFKFSEKIEIKLDRLGLYAFLSKDLDLDNKTYQEIYGRLSSLGTLISQAFSFITPELMTIPEETLNSFINENPELQIYRHYFENLIRSKEHILSKESENLLALSGNITPTASNTFSYLKNTDIQYPTIKDEDGNDFQISDGRYSYALFSTNREFRKEVYTNYYTPYKQFQNTFSSLFVGSIKSYIFKAKARKYNSTLELCLKPNNIPIEVYSNLVETVNNNLAPLHRWAALRKKVLNLDELHPYDTYVTMFPEIKKKFTYDEGVELVIKSLEILGEEYVVPLKEAFNNRRVDVYETKGKRSGAYSSGTTFGVNPYVLMNWNDELSDVSTLAHELGHNMHSLFTGQNQPYVYASYPIFLAEVASITNEALLLEYLLKNATTKIEKLSLLEMYANKFVTTFYRQIGFAEFELKTHQLTEKGEALNSDTLSSIYGDIYQKYWGKDVIMDDEEKLTWARVPHFYYGFYVYQYATGLAVAEQMVDNIIKDQKSGIESLMKFLKAGRSNYPIDVLKESNIDITNQSTIMNCISKFDSIITEIENNL